jgi:hypothetical protein
MIGVTSLKTVRAQTRKAFKMSDAELLAWFNQQIEASGKKPAAKATEMETLRLLRDALVKQTKRPRRRTKRARVSTRTKR